MNEKNITRIEFPATRDAISYTMQQHVRTGDVHALRWEGERITGISDAFNATAVDTMTAGMLPSVVYGPYQGDPSGLGPDGFVCWHPPTQGKVTITGPEAALLEPLGRLFRDWPSFLPETRQEARAAFAAFAIEHPDTTPFIDALLAELERVEGDTPAP